MYNNINVIKVIESCDWIQQKTISASGYAHSSCRVFDACMRAFDGKPNAEAVTFRVYFNSPVMKAGEVTIHRDGSRESRTTKEVIA